MLKHRRKVIISLHGINTDGAWQKHVAPIISEQGWVYFPLHYGHFSPLAFVRGKKRKEKLDWFRKEFENIKRHIEPIVPSVIAHSFGTYIICNSLEKFQGIRVDKLILCGSIVSREFDWKKIIEGKQVTAVKNDAGTKDFWAGNVHKFVSSAGASGRQGFHQKHERLFDENFARFEHSDFFGHDHYQNEWIPFLEKDFPYFGESVPPSQYEEPISPIEAARWSALTYYHQFVVRVVEAMRREEINSIAKKQFGDEENVSKSSVIKSKGLIVVIPKTPEGAKPGGVMDFSNKLSLMDATVGLTPRTVKYDTDGWLYDLPTILQTLSYLDHRKDDELGPAVLEFHRMLEKLLNGPHSDARDLVKIESIGKFNSPQNPL